MESRQARGAIRWKCPDARRDKRLGNHGVRAVDRERQLVEMGVIQDGLTRPRQGSVVTAAMSPTTMTSNCASVGGEWIMAAPIQDARVLPLVRIAASTVWAATAQSAAQPTKDHTHGHSKKAPKQERGAMEERERARRQVAAKAASVSECSLSGGADPLGR